MGRCCQRAVAPAEPRPHNNERILDKLVEVLERMVGRAFCRQPGIKRLRNSNRREEKSLERLGFVVIDLTKCPPRSFILRPPHPPPSAAGFLMRATEPRAGSPASLRSNTDATF